MAKNTQAQPPQPETSAVEIHLPSPTAKKPGRKVRDDGDPGTKKVLSRSGAFFLMPGPARPKSS